MSRQNVDPAAMTPQGMGRVLRNARLAAGITLQQLSDRTGFSMRLLSEAERGKAGVSIGRILSIATAVGVNVAATPAQSALIDIDRYPQLRLLAWQRGERRISERDALALYEANWRFVDTHHLAASEAALIKQLAQRHGRGVLNV